MRQMSHRVCGKTEELVFKRDLSEVPFDHHPETQLSVEPEKSRNASKVERKE